MQDYVIVTDSTSDLPLEIIKELNIYVIPMGFEIGGKSYIHYPDERELSIEDFYKKIKQGETSVTSQINYFTFKEYFKEILKEEKDILYIGFSSGLSGTFNNSQVVMGELRDEYPNRKIIGIDSICASLGEGLLVYNAASKKSQGMGIEELVKWLEDTKDNLCHWFTVEDLHHLKRGGRVSSIEAIVGTTLKIRPVLSVDHEGKLISISKVRGEKKSLEVLISRIVEDSIDLENQTIILGHGDNKVKAEKLADIIRDKNIVKDIVFSKVGPVVGTHTGAGIIGVAFIGNKKLK